MTAPDRSKKIRIVSDGTPRGTRVLIGDEVVPNVIAARWELAHAYGLATAAIEIVDVHVDVIGELDDTPIETSMPPTDGKTS